MRNLFFASAAMLALGVGLASPASAWDDELMNQVKVNSVQSLTMDDQWNIGIQWADTGDEWGAIKQTIEQTNAGLVIDVSAETNLKDCDCFDDVGNKVNVDLKQTVGMNEQINGALQVGLTDANITQNLSQLNVGGAASVDSAVNIPAIAAP